MSEDVAWINKQLKRQYGTDASGNTRFRVVWSDTQFERRRSSYTEKGIYLGPWQTIVRNCAKYPYLPARYVLEQFLPVHGNPELTTKTTYEPIYVFQDKDGNVLPPLYKVAKYIIDGIRERLSSPSDAVAEDNAKYDKEVAGFKEYLEDAGSSVIGSHLSMGSGIVVPGGIE